MGHPEVWRRLFQACIPSWGGGGGWEESDSAILFLERMPSWLVEFTLHLKISGIPSPSRCILWTHSILITARKSAFNSTGPAWRTENNSSHLDVHLSNTSVRPLGHILDSRFKGKGTLTSRRSLFLLPPSGVFTMKLRILSHTYSYIYFNSFILIRSFIPSNFKDITKYLFQSIGKAAHFISPSTLLLWLNGRLACLTYFLLFRIINSFGLWNVPRWMQEEPSVAISMPWLMLRTCINLLG